MSSLLHTPHGLRPWARRLAGWLLAALLLATLAPGLSRVLSTRSGDTPGEHWIELCSSQGVQWVRADLDPAGRDAPAPASDPLDLCGHCTLATERLAPLIPGLPVWPVLRAHEAVPAFVAAACGGTPMRAARARGPPFLG